MASGSSFSGFDRFGRVIDVLWTNSTFGDLAQLKYGYDRVSNRTYRQDVRAAAFGEKYDELYGYDNLQRLRAFDRGALDGSSLDRITTLTQRQSWQLDPTGNWNGFNNYDDQGGTFSALDQTRTQNAANEISAIGATIGATVGDVWETPVHDRNGNMTTMPKPSALTDGYNAKYDAWNRIANITEKTGGATVATYEYDGLNRRTLKVVSGTTTHFYYSDAWQVLEERLNALTTSNEQFVWGLRYIDDLVLRDRISPAERLYALQDANWNVVALTNASGVVQMRLVYDPYGTSTLLKENFDPYTGTDLAWEYRFTGRRLDIETGLYYFRERYYSARLGRFLNPDPIGYSATTEPDAEIRAITQPSANKSSISNDYRRLNLYLAFLGNPVENIDPFGLLCEVVANRTLSAMLSSFPLKFIFPKGINFGHEWIEFPGGSVGFWPNKGWLVLRPDPAVAAKTKVCWQWQTKIRITGKIKWGLAKGKKCCTYKFDLNDFGIVTITRNATCADIVDCLKNVPNPGWKGNAVINNCRRFSELALHGCCLKKGDKKTFKCP